LLAVIALLVFALPSARAADMTDQQISDAIEDELLFDQAVKINEIDVVTHEGIVTLSGKVGNLMARQRAGHLAESIKGVRSVVNRIQVAPDALRSDMAIRNDIIAALAADPATESYEVNVTVDDGQATLTGTVQSWQESILAGKVAASVKGLTGISNEIDVNYKSERPDFELKPEIEKALRWDTLVDHELIDVKVENGDVTLRGTVGSAAEKRRARFDALVTGVRSVDAEHLDVAKWARDEDLRKNKYTMASAEEMKAALNDALLYDPRVSSFNVDVDVTGSIVTLRGKVDNLKAKRAAANVARNTVGVSAVTNRLKVRGGMELSADEIQSNLIDALQRDPIVDRFDLNVDVIGQTAYLSGQVDSYYQKGQADDIASRTRGVHDVVNTIDVEFSDPLTYDPYVDDIDIYESDWYDFEPYYTFQTDQEIKEEINDELWWSPFVDEDEVNVSVDAGTATLTGTVDSWSERDAATENAYEGGATWVINNLNVE
jgi:osmotically-inducible protein OsmY